MQDCPTRWGSKQQMISRIIEQARAIRQVLADDRRATNSLTWQDVDVLKAVNEGLEPVSKFTDALSGDAYVTSSSILPILQLLKEDILAPSEGDVRLTAQLKSGMFAKLDAKYANDSVQKLLRNCTFVDPRYRGQYDSNVDETKGDIETEMIVLGRQTSQVNIRVEECAQQDAGEEQPAKKKKTTLASLLAMRAVAARPVLTVVERAHAELVVYMQEDAIDMEENPLQWWKLNETRLPLLSRVARKYLCICASSAASERIFSTAGNTVTPQRSQLKPDKVNMLVFLAKNLD